MKMLQYTTQTMCLHLIIQYSIISLKILALAGIWTRDFPGTKPICYQLSYPGLDQKIGNIDLKIPLSNETEALNTQMSNAIKLKKL